MTKKIPVAKVGEIMVGSSRSFRFMFMEGIAYNDGGEIKAYVNVCTHAGGHVKQQGNVFRCQMHFAEFDPATGQRLSGQAPEGSALKPIPLVTEGDQIYAVYKWENE